LVADLGRNPDDDGCFSSKRFSKGISLACKAKPGFSVTGTTSPGRPTGVGETSSAKARSGTHVLFMILPLKVEETVRRICAYLPSFKTVPNTLVLATVVTP